jgi:hypothetical protein
LAPTFGLTGFSGFFPQFQIVVLILPFLALVARRRGTP